MSCEDIRGHEVRLYHPQSAHPNVTSRVGANENFYVVKEDNQLNSDETYVQVVTVFSNNSYHHCTIGYYYIIIAVGSSYS